MSRRGSLTDEDGIDGPLERRMDLMDRRPRRRPLTLNQLDLLEHIANGGDVADWQVAGDLKCSGALAFQAREKVVDSLIKRGLMTWDGDAVLTDAGRAALAAAPKGSAS